MMARRWTDPAGGRMQLGTRVTGRSGSRIGGGHVQQRCTHRRRVFEFAVQRPFSSLKNTRSLPGTTCWPPSGRSFCQPASKSYTSLETVVLSHTTMNTGGVPRSAVFKARHCSKAHLCRSTPYSVGSFVGCSQNSLSTGFAAFLEECPQVKRVVPTPAPQDFAGDREPVVATVVVTERRDHPACRVIGPIGPRQVRDKAQFVTSRGGSRCTRRFRSHGSPARPGSAAWRVLPRRRPASRTPARSPRRGSSCRPLRSPGP
jgi:hypothetical protein